MVRTIQAKNNNNYHMQLNLDNTYTKKEYAIKTKLNYPLNAKELEEQTVLELRK